MAKVGSGSIVTALTVAALAAVGALAWQANAAAERPAHKAAAKPAHHGATPAQVAARKARMLPVPSGEGRRVVYSLARRRVWLVTAANAVSRTFEVVPGTVLPAPGEYAVGLRKPSITGTDGVPVENIVYFALSKQTVIAFDDAVDGSLPAPDPEHRTGGIRERRADGAAMWQFATTGTKVVVVP